MNMKRLTTTAVLALALLAGACGGGNESSGKDNGVASIDGKQAGSDKDGGAKKQSFEEAALAFSRCMRKNGVNMPDPGEGGMLTVGPNDTNNVPRDVMEKAEAACKKEREAMQGSMGEPPADFQDKMFKMAKCMRAKGINMPDPHTTPDGKASVEIDPDAIKDPKFQAAEKECRKEVQLREPGSAPKGDS